MLLVGLLLNDSLTLRYCRWCLTLVFHSPFIMAASNPNNGTCRCCQSPLLLAVLAVSIVAHPVERTVDARSQQEHVEAVGHIRHLLAEITDDQEREALLFVIMNIDGLEEIRSRMLQANCVAVLLASGSSWAFVAERTRQDATTAMLLLAQKHIGAFSPLRDSFVVAHSAADDDGTSDLTSGTSASAEADSSSAETIIGSG
jgi:hypothetical protein